MITSRHIQPSNFWGLTKQVGPWKTTSTDLAHEAHGYDSPHNQVQEVRPFQQDGSTPQLTWTTPKIVDPGNLTGFKNPGIAKFGDRAPLGRNVQIFNQQFFNGTSGEAEVLQGKPPSTPLPTTITSHRSEIKREAKRDAERAGQIGAPLVPSRDLKPTVTRKDIQRLKEHMTGDSDLQVDTDELQERFDEGLTSRRERDESMGFSIRGTGEGGTREDLTKIPQPVVAPPPVKQEVADRAVEVFVPVKEEMMAVDPLTVQDVVPEKGLFKFIEPGTGLVLRKHSSALVRRKKSLTVEDISEPFLAPSPRHFGKSRNLLKAGKIDSNMALMNRVNANSGQLQVAFRVPKNLPPVTRAVVKRKTPLKKTPVKRDVAVAVKKGELVPAERRSILGKKKEVFVSRKKFIVKK